MPIPEPLWELWIVFSAVVIIVETFKALRDWINQK